MENFNGEKIYAGDKVVSSGYITDKNSLIKAGGVSVFIGALNSFKNSANSKYVTFDFQETAGGDQKRVIIKAGSSDAQNLYDVYADGISRSAYWQNSGYALPQAVIASSAANLYSKLSGVETYWYETYDLEITVDPAHRGSGYTSYLWISESGDVIETPIIFSKDKVQLGKRSGFLNFGFDPLYTMPIDGTSPIAQEYQELFNNSLERK